MQKYVSVINFEQMDRYNLPAYCTLLGDDIMVLATELPLAHLQNPLLPA